jgi:hypothetical protein
MAGNPPTEFDAVIPYHAKDSEILPYCIFGLRKYATGLRNIYVVSKEDPEEDCIWIPESEFPFDMSIITCRKRQGWYLQQLIKLYAFRCIQTLDHVLIYDSDCVMCRPVSFFKDEQILLDWTDDTPHIPYILHGKRVLPDFKQHDPLISGIRDHIMAKKDIMESFLRKIELHTGKEAWRGLLEAVEPTEHIKSGMSEYELYYNYVLVNHPSLYTLRKLDRQWVTSFAGLQTSADIVTFHSWTIDIRKKRIESSRTGEELGDETRARLAGQISPAQNL